MNLNEFGLNRIAKADAIRKSAGAKNVVMGPPAAPAPKKKKSSSASSHIHWGRNITSVFNTTVSKSDYSASKSSELDSKIIVALTEGRGGATCEVGLAAINVSKPTLVLCQISDSQSYINTLSKINILDPTEVLVPSTFVDKFTENRLIQKLKMKFPHMKITNVARGTFSKVIGMDRIQQLCIPDLRSIELVLQHKYYALAAASALLSYIQDKLYVYYASGSIKVEYQESEGHAIIDIATADILELVSSTKPAQANKYSSLYACLNKCLTKIGARTLRSSILQPFYDTNYINRRLDCVSELIKEPHLLLSIQAILQKIPNIDVLLSITTLMPDGPNTCSYRHLNYLLLVNSVLECILPLKDILQNYKQEFFVNFKRILASDDFTTIKESLRKLLHENARQAKGQGAVMERCFAIKAGVNGLLDLIRKTYSERLDDMKEYVRNLGAKYELPLTLNNNATKGYHIVLNLNQQQKRYMKKSDLPTEFIQVQRLAGSFTMKTPQLLNFSTRIDDIMNDIIQISNVMVYSEINTLKKFLGIFYDLVEGIAQLDLLQSLAETSLTYSYIKPEFSSYFTEVTFSRHPMLDLLLSNRPVSNLISSSKDYNIHIISGPNGSGKSVFIRQVLLLQVMAQIGCYVPAQTAVFRPADKMFARVYLEDNMECGASSFVLEMKEVKYIMSTMTDNSLIIIDELCRSTSLEEGSALAMAICEKLSRSSAFLYLTTHYTLISRLHDMYLNIKAWKMETDMKLDNQQNSFLHFKYTVIPGINTIERYGVYVAKDIWPDDVMQDMYKCLDNIAQTSSVIKVNPLNLHVRMKYETKAKINTLKSCEKLTRELLQEILENYRSECHKMNFIVEEDVAMTFDLNSTSDNVFRLSLVNKPLEINSHVPIPDQDKRYTPFLPYQPLESWDLNDAVSSTSSYRNMSEFLNNNSGNINYLIPEVNITEEQFQLVGNHMENQVFNSPKSQADVNVTRFGASCTFSGYDTNNTSGCGSYNFHKMDQINGLENLQNEEIQSIVDELEICSQLLQNDSEKFDSQVENERTENDSEISRLSHDSQTYKAFTENLHPYHSNIENPSSEVESIREELEACSEIFRNESDCFEEQVYVPKRQYEHYVSPKVKLLPGSTPSTFKSFGEEDGPDNDFLQNGYMLSPAPNRNEFANLNLSEEEVQEASRISDVILSSTNYETCRDGNTSSDETSSVDVIVTNKSKFGVSTDKLPSSSTSNKGSQKDISNKEFENDLSRNSMDKESILISRVNSNNESNKRLNHNCSSVSNMDITNSDEEGFRKISSSNMSKSLSNQQSSKGANGKYLNTTPTKQRFNSTNSSTSITISRKLASMTETLNTSKSNNLDTKTEALMVNNEQINVPKQLSYSLSSNLNNSRNSMTADSLLPRGLNDSISNNRGSSTFDISNGTRKRNSSDNSSESLKKNKTSRMLETSNELQETIVDGNPKITPASDIDKDKSTGAIKQNQTSSELDSSSTNQNQAPPETSSNKESDTSLTNQTTPKNINAKNKKFQPPKVSNSVSQSDNFPKSKLRRVGLVKSKSKFIPPKKLTRKEIRQEFMEQDRKFFESDMKDSSNLDKYLKQLINRPTVQQVQQAKHLMLIRKTTDGVEVISAEPTKPKVKKSKYPMIRSVSNRIIDPTIFSDENAEAFELFLNSKENTSTFNFSFEKKDQFKFQPMKEVMGEYTSSSFSYNFTKKSSTNSIKNSQTNFTPDGYYKENKLEINSILEKYRNTEQNKPSQRSIFEEEEFNSDFEL